MLLMIISILYISITSCSRKQPDEAILISNKILEKDYYDLKDIVYWLNSKRELYSDTFFVRKIRSPQTVMIDTTDNTPWLELESVSYTKYLYNFMDKNHFIAIVVKNINIKFIFNYWNKADWYYYILYCKDLKIKEYLNYKFYEGNEIPNISCYWIYLLDTNWYLVSPPRPN